MRSDAGVIRTAVSESNSPAGTPTRLRYIEPVERLTSLRRSSVQSEGGLGFPRNRISRRTNMLVTRAASRRTGSSGERAPSEHAPQRRGNGRLREPQDLATVIEEEPAGSTASELRAERIERPRVGYADVARGLHLDRQEALPPLQDQVHLFAGDRAPEEKPRLDDLRLAPCEQVVQDEILEPHADGRLACESLRVENAAEMEREPGVAGVELRRLDEPLRAGLGEGGKQRQQERGLQDREPALCARPAD